MTDDTVREWHDRIGSMIDQVGHPDYSLREMINGLRHLRDDMLSAAPQSSEAPAWIPLVEAPLDGTEVELLVRNGAYFRELKANGKEFADKLWQEVVRAKWIDHNQGGWTYHGMAGTPVGWRPLPPAPEKEEK